MKKINLTGWIIPGMICGIGRRAARSQRRARTYAAQQHLSARSQSRDGMQAAGVTLSVKQFALLFLTLMITSKGAPAVLRSSLLIIVGALGRRTAAVLCSK